ncbi:MULTISPECIES: IS66-like element accessory protein TnpA [Marinobacter]|uniref:IS66-like element accessory protein TnpA n=1 Tax=Marinobacter TaxID=2742 RepID=UPI0019085AF9|nr:MULTISPECIES: transposase [unclassified Marinobacter]MBK1887885.1 transposase [Marinobacter sp. DY40_1A1]
MNHVSVPRPYRKRCRHAPEFKARLVAEYHSPGASVLRIALDNDLNANQLRRWIRETKQADGGLPPAFVPVRLPAMGGHTTNPADTDRTIRIETPRAGGSVVVEWPADQGQQCAAFLRKLLS